MADADKKPTDVIHTTLRLPRLLDAQLKVVAEAKNLSKQQAVMQAILEYCDPIDGAKVRKRARRR